MTKIPTYWRDATTYLTLRDDILAKSIAAYPNEVLLGGDNPFQTLMRAVVGQQISVKAADSIWQRLEKQLKTISPSQFLTVESELLRQCGLSRQKIDYIGAIARAFEAKILIPSAWQQMSDEDIVRQLMAIRGIGQWTAEMFLIFYLNRPDVLPLSDLGLINAIRLHYGDLAKSDILIRSKQWQPYRTVATWYLWRSLDPVVVQY